MVERSGNVYIFNASVRVMPQHDQSTQLLRKRLHVFSPVVPTLDR